MALRDHVNAQFKQDLVDFQTGDGQCVSLLGETAMGDTPLRFYYFDETSSLPVDGENVIMPVGLEGPNGRYIKIPAQAQMDWDDLSNKPLIPTNTNQLINGSGFLTSESDPTVPAYAKTLTAFSAIKTATDPLYRSITYTPTFAEITGKPTTLAGYGITDAVSTARGAISLTTNGNNGAATYNSTSGVLNIPQYTVSAAPTFNNAVVRALNSNFTISSSQNARVNYTVRVSYSITVLLGSTGVISLQYSTNGGVNWITVSTISNNLNLGIALTGYNDFNLSGEIPANGLVRLNSTTSNATNSYITGQEVLN